MILIITLKNFYLKKRKQVFEKFINLGFEKKLKWQRKQNLLKN